MSAFGKGRATTPSWWERSSAGCVVRNLLNRKKLRHNRKLYELYGLNKSIYAPISSRDFRAPSPVRPPVCDRPEATFLFREDPDWAQIPEKWKPAILEFPETGVLILRKFFSRRRIDSVNRSIDALAEPGRPASGSLVNAQDRSEPLDRLYRDEWLQRLLGLLLGQPVAPFRSFYRYRTDHAPVHADSLHLTTEPKGYALSAWVAMERVTTAQGPLVYYPGSHRLPYLSREDLSPFSGLLSADYDWEAAYERRVAGWIAERALRPRAFCARPGDLIVWHPNLLHAEAEAQKKGASRRSLEAHFFARGVICYHEINQAPALLTEPTF